MIIAKSLLLTGTRSLAVLTGVFSFPTLRWVQLDVYTTTSRARLLVAYPEVGTSWRVHHYEQSSSSRCLPWAGYLLTCTPLRAELVFSLPTLRKVPPDVYTITSRARLLVAYPEVGTSDTEMKFFFFFFFLFEPGVNQNVALSAWVTARDSVFFFSNWHFAFPVHLTVVFRPIPLLTWSDR